MKKILIAVYFLVAVSLAGCADEGQACQAVSNMGFSRCRVAATHYVGAGFYGCHSDDNAAFEVNAVNPAGRRVSFVVCCGNGPFGSCTLRNQ